MTYVLVILLLLEVIDSQLLLGLVIMAMCKELVMETVVLCIIMTGALADQVAILEYMYSSK